MLIVNKSWCQHGKRPCRHNARVFGSKEKEILNFDHSYYVLQEVIPSSLPFSCLLERMGKQSPC